MSLPTRQSIQRLKAKVEAQESRLKEGIKMLSAAKKKEQSKATSSVGYAQKIGQTSEWDALERVIRQMDDLLISYKKYSSELERRLRQLVRKGGSKKSVKV
jgi:hypothetical protein